MTHQEQPTTEDTMRTLGQITRVVFKSAALPPNILSMLLSKPATGMGLLMRSAEGIRAMDRSYKNYDARVTRLVDKLPAELPSGPIGVEAQGPFWLGYYQTPDWPVKRDVKHLREAGEALFGGTWQTSYSALAQALGISDERRVREWLSGESRIPSGVLGDIKRLLHERSVKAEAMASDLDESSPSLEDQHMSTTYITYTAYDQAAEYGSDDDQGYPLTAKTDSEARVEAKQLAEKKGWKELRISFFRSSDGCRGEMEV